MQVLSYTISAIILAIMDYFTFEKKRSNSYLIRILLGYGLLFNIISLNIVKYIIKAPNILESSLYTSNFSIKYIVFTVALGSAFLLIKSVVNSKINLKGVIFKEAKEKSSRKRKVMKTISFIICILGSICIFFSQWAIEYVGKITPEQIIFNLVSPTGGGEGSGFRTILMVPVFAILACAIVFWFVTNFKYDIFIIKKESENKILSQRKVIVSSLVLSCVLFLGGAHYGVKKLNLQVIYKSLFKESTFIGDNYVSPKDVNISFPKKKRNLVHIYLESVENSFFSKEQGGYMDENLMPELYELYKEGVSFSHNEKLGGPKSTHGTSWSVAGFVNMGAGIPVKIVQPPHTYGLHGSFLPGAITIGDILEEQGYNQTILFGSDADFGGLDTYFKTHGNYNIFDYKAAKEKKLIPKDYKVWWGFEDDKLYEYAKLELTRLHKEGKPFNLTIETADTHFPDGYLSKHAEKKHDSQYANVISYSTKGAAELVRWIQEQPFYEDTTIVITGDHLSMDKAFFEGWDESYDRSVVNLILNAPIEAKNMKNRQFAPFDFYPTILASLGVDIEGDKLGLGTNLFSNKQTLLEMHGLEKVDDELSKKSNFYIKELLSESKRK